MKNDNPDKVDAFCTAQGWKTIVLFSKAWRHANPYADFDAVAIQRDHKVYRKSVDPDTHRGRPITPRIADYVLVYIECQQVERAKEETRVKHVRKTRMTIRHPRTWAHPPVVAFAR